MPATPQAVEVTAAKRFEKADGKRDQILQRGRDAADLTIPALMPPQGIDENSNLPTPYQSLGARGVNNLTSKLRLSLFPPGQPFFRFKLDAKVIEELNANSPEGLAKIEKAMQQLEKDALDELEQGTDSITLQSALKQLVTVGNVLMHMPANEDSRIFRLANYVVFRDASGAWFEIVAKEIVNRLTLPDGVQVNLKASANAKDEDDIDIYTRIVKNGNKAEWHQEIEDVMVPGSEGSSDYEDCPYMPLRWSALDGENYGRGHVEEYLGDLRSLEGLSKAILQGAAAAAKVIFLDRPASTTDLEALQNAESGEFVEGNIEDIGVLQLNKFHDFRVAKDQIDDLSLRISHAFLLTAGTVRNAERVTAEEIRMQAQELEDVLGGVYTVLASELQRRVVRRLIARLKAKGKFPTLPKGAINPVIVTGFEALGRGHELNKFRQFFADGSALFGEAFIQEFNVSAVSDMLATNHNINIDAVKKTQDQKDAERAAEQQASLVHQTAGPIAGAATKGIVDAANPQSES